MDKFTTLTAIAAPLLRINIDTDAIIPSREMKRVSKEGLGEGLFAAWRYTEPGSRNENPDFILNQEPYRQAQILLAGTNFGCGSSREHAAWALAEWGIRAIIAPSFGTIFYANCVRNGILPAVLPEGRVQALAALVAEDPKNNQINIDLEKKIITTPDQLTNTFDIAPSDQEMLMEGLDTIAVTMKRDDEILAFQAQDRLKRPWIYL
ncbi:MAG: 3-isopropylmalate dehydratase small subunit [Gammaproteobacteria bacterium]|jgi:3-isopropylmalate/(R)-2-methylmalate dehydratase small subunit|nr:3-isopropylmalate dehydratase small subunit [Chromatiales bacterium]MDP6675190.1 3-isopropylmalate dehydratase small subunit [Gammaproteobacteria bacterium]